MNDKKINELKKLLRLPRPKGTSRAAWKKHRESLEHQLYLLQNDLEIKEEPGKNYGKNFWGVTENVIMRTTMGTAWGVSKTGVPSRHETDYSRGAIPLPRSRFTPK